LEDRRIADPLGYPHDHAFGTAGPAAVARNEPSAIGKSDHVSKLHLRDALDREP